MKTPLGKTLSLLASLALASSVSAQTIGMNDPLVPESMEPDSSPVLRLGPVDGLTTAWHKVPAAFAVPQGSELLFEFEWDEPHLLSWSGAQAVAVSATTAQAQAFMDELGSQRISVSALAPSGEFLTGWILDVDVLPAAAFEGDVPLPELFHYEAHVDPSAPVLQGGSNAAPIYLDRGARKVVGYGGPLGAAVVDAPEALQPLLEWRLDGEAVGLGAMIHMQLDDPGEYLLEVGPPASAAVVALNAPEQHAQADGWSLGGMGGGGSAGALTPCAICYAIKCGVTKEFVGGPGQGIPAVVVRNNSKGKATFTVSAVIAAFSIDCAPWQLQDAQVGLPANQTVELEEGQIFIVRIEGFSNCDLQLRVTSFGKPVFVAAQSQGDELICTRHVWTKY